MDSVKVKKKKNVAMTGEPDRNHTGSSVARVTKGRVRALGRGARSKNKLQSPTQKMHGGGPATCHGTGGRARQCKPGPQRSSRQALPLRVATWNVSSITGKELELVEEMKSYRIDVVGISSTKRRGSGTVDLEGGWKLFYSGVQPTESARAGVGILTSPRLTDCAVEWIPSGGRIGLLKLNLGKRFVWIVQVYAPNHEAQYQPFLDELSTALDVVGTDSFILLGDFNAHVGTDSLGWKGVIGRNGAPALNANGKMLLHFCASSGLSIMNTFFQHKDIHKYTWYRHACSQRSLIDFIVVSADLFKSVLDVRVKRGAELSTDHHLVVCDLKLSEASITRRARRQNAFRIRWERLTKDDVRKTYADSITSRYKELPDEVDDIETEWDRFKRAVTASAVKSCGQKRLCVSHGDVKKTPWFNQEVRDALRAKKRAFRSWLQNPSAHTREEYVEARKEAVKTAKDAKTASWEEFGHKLDSDYQSAKKVFWQTIRRLRGGKRTATPTIFDSQGKPISSEKAILERWRKYFADLLNPATSTSTDTEPETPLGDDDEITEENVASAIRSLKRGKSPGEDEIRPEMLQSMPREGILWLKRVCQVAWSSGKAPMDWQSGIVVPIFKNKGNRRDCANYRGISLLSIPGKVYSRCLETRARGIVEPQLAEGQCGFRPGRSTTDQIFTLRQVFEKAWEYNLDICACFVDLQKAYDRVPRDKLWGVMREYGVNGRLLNAIKSLYERSESCVRVNGVKSRSFRVNSGLRQGCVLSPLLFITFMDRIDRRSRGGVGATVGRCSIDRLLFADDLVLLGPTQSALQNALDSFDAECCEAGMVISTDKSKTLVLSRKPFQCDLHVSGSLLEQVEKFKYLGVEFTSDGKWEVELSRRIALAGAIVQQLRRSVILKRELGINAKLAIFKSVFRPTLTYGHEPWVMTERTRSRVQAAEMAFLRRTVGLTRLDRVRSSAIREQLQIEPLLLWIERSQLRYYGHVMRMSEDRLVQRILLAQPCQRRPRGRPRMRWWDYILNLCRSRLNISGEELAAAVSCRQGWRGATRALPPRPERNSGPRR